MQAKPVLRMMAVFIVAMGMLVAMVIFVPASPAHGHASTIRNTTYQSRYIASLSLSLLPQEEITNTISTTPTKAISESVVLAPTPAGLLPIPKNDQTGIIANFMRLVQTRPWVPLGFILVILLTALTIILITAQRKITTAQLPSTAGTDTAQLQPRPTPSQDMAFLQLKLQPETTFPLVIADLTMGRAFDNSIVILPEIPGAETVSHYHARLYRSERWILEDLNSTNGTYVNGQRTGRNYLRNGWEIGVGGVIFVFHTGKVEE